jgi:hypothetical protein
LKNTPLVLLAYNRADKLEKLISALTPSRPQTVLVVVDGPKFGNATDEQKVLETRKVASTISWTNNVEFIFRPTNIGLKDSVQDAVTYATEKYGRAIMLEDDARPGPTWLPYATAMLDKYESERKIEHISGYDMVPPSVLSSAGIGSRLSRYPESYAWATWQRAWSNYDSSLEWGLNATVADLERIVGTRIGALRWKQNFHDAAAGRISTWAYRWLASMWSRNSYMVSPNANLVTYDGYSDGTHTFLKPGWSELPVFKDDFNILVNGVPEYDSSADNWAADHVYSETLYGVTRGIAISGVLELRKYYRRSKKYLTR